MIVEGEGELDALKILASKIGSKYKLVPTPLRADMQPKASANVIARSAATVVRFHHRHGVQRIVVLIDREDHDCAVDLGKQIKKAFEELYADLKISFSVVVKDSKVENWLIADPEGLKKMKSHFDITTGFVRSVSGKADNVRDAHAMLKAACRKGQEYRKGTDPESICKHVDPLRAAKNSRSFRKFLRELGEPTYAKQSKRVG
jgi:hypothetical protein